MAQPLPLVIIGAPITAALKIIHAIFLFYIRLFVFDLFVFSIYH